MYLKFLCRTLERRGHLFGALQIRVFLILHQNYCRRKHPRNLRMVVISYEPKKVKKL